MRISPRLAAVIEPPIKEIRSWVVGRSFPADRPLIDAARAVPDYPPPSTMTDHLAGVIGRPEMALYTDILGLPALREALAAHLSSRYGGTISAGEVGIVAGGNQGFAAVLRALTDPGDDVIVPLPYYWNHQMWLDMIGVEARYLPFRPERNGVPDASEAAALIGPRTRAIVLVTPNNPTGAVYPPGVIEAFHDLAASRGIALVIDETYQDFVPGEAPPHDLFARRDWPGTLVQVYSFSKVFGLTGYRVGSVVCGAALLAQIAKVLDCIAICAPRIGQEAALWGLANGGRFGRERRALLARRIDVLRSLMASRPGGYEIVSAGAYFAYLRHPVAGVRSTEVAHRLAVDHGLLTVPGDAFGPGQEAYLRVAVSNLAEDRLPALVERFAQSARR